MFPISGQLRPPAGQASLGELHRMALAAAVAALGVLILARALL